MHKFRKAVFLAAVVTGAMLNTHTIQAQTIKLETPVPNSKGVIEITAEGENKMLNNTKIRIKTETDSNAYMYDEYRKVWVGSYLPWEEQPLIKDVTAFMINTNMTQSIKFETYNTQSFLSTYSDNVIIFTRDEINHYRETLNEKDFIYVKSKEEEQNNSELVEETTIRNITKRNVQILATKKSSKETIIGYALISSAFAILGYIQQISAKITA